MLTLNIEMLGILVIVGFGLTIGLVTSIITLIGAFVLTTKHDDEASSHWIVGSIKLGFTLVAIYYTVVMMQSFAHLA